MHLFLAFREGGLWFSNVWKKASNIFQCLENRLPALLLFKEGGRRPGWFSNAWKILPPVAAALLAVSSGAQPPPALAPGLAAQIQAADGALPAGKQGGGPWAAQGEYPDDAFGYAVTGAGDVNGDGQGDAVVGAPGYGGARGKVYVFHGATNGLKGTTAQPAWSAMGEALDDRFGYAATAAGDVNGDGYGDLMVGAYGYSTNRGKLYLFYGSANGITGTAASPGWSVRGENPWDWLGHAAAAAGDVNGDGYADIVVGAFLYNGGQGKTYVFHGGASGPAAASAAAANWKVPGEHVADDYGFAVAGAGDMNGDGYDDVLVGAYKWSGNRGRAYLYRGSAAGITAPSAAAAPLIMAGTTNNDFFGYSVAGPGDLNGDGYADVVVGAPHYKAGANQGRIYMTYGYATSKGDKGSLGQTMITGENANDLFGYTVAGVGDMNGDGYADVLVGANDYPGGTKRGKIYVFRGTANGLFGTYATDANWTLNGATAGDCLGSGLGPAGDVDGDGLGDVVLGAYGYSGGEKRGQAMIYYGYTALPNASPKTMTGEHAADGLGCPAMSAGDVNGDGYGDLLVSASRYDNGRGKVYVFHGTATNLVGSPAAPAWSATGENTGDGFGTAAVAAGDVNGDGYDDILVGAQNYNSGGAYAGKVYVFHGSPAGITNHGADHATWCAIGEASNSFFGKAVAGVGDVNGDGYADILAAGQGFFSIGRGGGSAFRFKVYAFHGSPAGVSGSAAQPAWYALGETTSDLFGDTVAGAGDVNGDGFADILVGAWHYVRPSRASPPPKYRGKAYVFEGSAAGLQGTATQPAWSSEGQRDDDLYGRSVAGAGDINGDGFDDVLVGAPGYPSNRVGRAYAYYGSAAGVTGTATNPAWRFTGTAAGDAFGYSVAGAGDVNGDGFADVLVGAVGYPAGGWRGCMYLFCGSANFSLVNYASWTDTGENNMDSYGLAVAGAGDITGDGFADLVTAAPSWTNGTGKLYFYSGNWLGSGRSARLQALQYGTDQPLAPWGRSAGGNLFRARMNGFAPFGRARVKLQVQAVPAGRPFGAAGTLQATAGEWTATPTGAAGAPVTVVVNTLAAQGLYHWRARLLYAPFTACAPLTPAHGPWRTLHAQAGNAGPRGGSGFPPWWILLF